MPHLVLDWRLSLELATALLALAGVLRLSLGTRGPVAVAAALQGALLVGLYGLWGLVGTVAEGTARGAQARGQAIWDAERHLRVLDEAGLQSLVLPHPLLTQAANAYYVYGHVNLMIALLAWVWLRHRAHYLRVCCVLVVLTVASSALQLLSVAPPRLLASHPVVDTAIEYGQSVYGAADPGAVSQLAAMPSIHVGWALLEGLTVVALGRTRKRWLALAHPVVMTLVVVVTGNHYWADAAVAAVLLAAALGVVTGGRRRLDRQGAAGVAPEPAAV